MQIDEIIDVLNDEPPKAFSMLCEMEGDLLKEMWAELSQHLESDGELAYQLLFALGNESGALGEKLMEQGVISSPMELISQFWNSGARSRALALLNEIPATKAMQRTVAAVIFNAIMHSDWSQSRNSLFSGISSEAVDKWFEDLKRGRAAALLESRVEAFSPLFADDVNFDIFLQHINVHMLPELEEASLKEKCLASYRSQMLERPELSFAYKITGVLVFLSDEGLDYYDSVVPALEKMGLPDSSFSEIREWFLYGITVKPQIPEQDTTRLKEALDSIDGFDQKLRNIGVDFDPSLEIFRSSIAEFRQDESAGVWSQRFLAILEAAVTETALQKVIFSAFRSCFNPSCGFAKHCADWDDVRDNFIEKKIDRAVFLRQMSKVTMVNVIWNASSYERDVLNRIELPDASTPADWVENVIKEIGAECGDSHKTIVTLLLAAWSNADHVSCKDEDILGLWDLAVNSELRRFKYDSVFQSVGSRRVYQIMEEAGSFYIALNKYRQMLDFPEVYNEIVNTCIAGLDPQPSSLSQEIALDIFRLVSTAKWKGNFDLENNFFESVLGIEGSEFYQKLSEQNGEALAEVKVINIFNWLEENIAVFSGVDDIRYRLSQDIFERITCGQKVDKNSVIEILRLYTAGQLPKEHVLECYNISGTKLDELKVDYINERFTDTSRLLDLKKHVGDFKEKKRTFYLRHQLGKIMIGILVILSVCLVFYYKNISTRVTPVELRPENVLSSEDLIKGLLQEMGFQKVASAAGSSARGLSSSELKRAFVGLNDSEYSSLTADLSFPKYEYWMLKAPVQNALFEELFPDSPSLKRKPTFQLVSDALKHPVVNISYDHAELFCQILTTTFKARNPACINTEYAKWIFRLPTEAEWMGAAVHGSKNVYWWGNSWSEAPAKIRNLNIKSTIPIRDDAEMANDAGFTGFNFNVSEWCWSPLIEGVKEEAFALHLVKGAAWPLNDMPEWKRSVYYQEKARLASDQIGFRIVFGPPL